jgi:putative endonuclease
MKFYYVYALHNKEKDFLYVGYSEDLPKRIKAHNDGKSKSTKHFRPLTLAHYEAYINKKDAKRRELYLKSTKGRTTLRYMLKEHLEGQK